MQPGPGSYYPEQSKRDLHVNEVVGKASKRLHTTSVFPRED